MEGLITYGNVPPQKFISGSMTISHGGSPSYCEMVCAPFGNPSLYGTLTWRYGGQGVVFPKAHLVDVHFETDGAGHQYMILTIADRRWAWRFGWVEGIFNIPNPNSGAPYREKKPSELIKLLMTAMGETSYIAQDVPDDVRPFVDWNEPPLDALLNLCDELGMRLMLDHIANKAKVVRLNQGARLPNLPTAIQDSLDLSQPGVPDKFIFRGAPAEWQWDFELEAVGEKQDGSIVPIEQLDWKPNGGFKNCLPPLFAGVDVNHKELAKKCLYRWYRPRVPLAKGKLKKGEIAINFLDQIYLHNRMVETRVIDRVEIMNVLPAMLYGEYDALNMLATTPPKRLETTHGKKAVYERGFSINPDDVLVILDEPAILHVDAGGNAVTAATRRDAAGLVPAKLYLRCTASVRDLTSWSLFRSTYEWSPPGQKLGTPPYVVQRNDSCRVYWLDSKSRTWMDNSREFDEVARHYLQQALAEFQGNDPGSAVYAGLVPIPLDGAIRQVTFSIDSAGFTTTSIHRSREDRMRSITFDEQRQRNAMRMTLLRRRAGNGRERLRRKNRGDS